MLKTFKELHLPEIGVQFALFANSKPVFSVMQKWVCSVIRFEQGPMVKFYVDQDHPSVKIQLC